MYNEPQIERMLSKLRQYENTLNPYIFKKIDELKVTMFETDKELFKPPVDVKKGKVAKKGDHWGKERSYCWFNGEYTVPKEYAGTPIYIYPKFGGYEALLYVNGFPYGNFAYKICATGHGNHYCDLLVLKPTANQKVTIDLEAYAGTFVPGCMPFEEPNNTVFNYEYDTIDICVKDEEIADFIFDLRALNQLAKSMDKNSFRRADIINCLNEVHKIVYYSPEHIDEQALKEGLRKARKIMKPCLNQKNAESAPKVGIIGHSHMDTAWLWDISQTIKKCARTFANQLALMDQYDEYTFIQSSAYHLEMIRRHYPELFEEIKKRIKSGRYEPNGGVWIECDCNITSGESMIRQFLWGQRYTRKHFNFTSNSFWLPDTFGYSASLPQIMKGCDVDYFLTTKIAWNDTNKFPYETFLWEGIDGTTVPVHFNCTHIAPDPSTLIERVDDRGSGIGVQQKTVYDERLISYGFGDGGGGPEFEMIEMSRRCKDLDGCAKAYHTTVTEFMDKLSKNMKNPNTYSGELYLELHRGTLTNRHTIKRNNRKGEIALHNAEILTVNNAILDNIPASCEELNPLTETLLVNQFHDILPGTCIQSAMEQAEHDVGEMIKSTNKVSANLAKEDKKSNKVTFSNMLGFDYTDIITVPINKSVIGKDIKSQEYTDLNGNDVVDIYGITIPSLASVTLDKVEFNSPAQKSSFKFTGTKLTTPFANITFNKNGYMSSFIDKRNNRELVKGLPFNTFLFADDVPNEWDNWDIDCDIQEKFKDCAVLLNREIITDGEVELRIRSEYRLSEKTTIKQDMVFYSFTSRVDFFTKMDWHDKRKFLKTCFDTDILTRTARHEIQFGCVQKPTTRNTSIEQAMFEVVNHKYTDLSETQYGCAVLNDCKYGVSAEGEKIRLSLHKAGIRPDPRGDEGTHDCVYSFLPHNDGFSAASVTKPAYMLNYKPFVTDGEYTMNSLLNVNRPNIIIETIKPCEDAQKAFIARIYEAEGTYTTASLDISNKFKKAELCNMLEESKSEIKLKDNSFELSFKPFEIKTVKIYY